MNDVLTTLVMLVAVSAGVPIISLVIEALRPIPAAPQQLRWAPNIPIRYVKINGFRLRYIQAGKGPALVLLHTLRTQLDLFEKVVPRLAERFTVYALDLPGHGYSDIPDAAYDAGFFTDAVEGFLEVMHLRDVTLAGVSIGASLALIVAARHNSRVARAIAINPYDYAKGRGMARSSFLARLVVGAADIPVLGETMMRLRTFYIMKSIFNGGLADRRSISPQLLQELYMTGNRKGHYRAFLSLLRNAESWQLATKDYRNIKIPVLLIWGDRDWAKSDEKERDRQLAPDAEMVTVEQAGHFLPLDRPDAVIEDLSDFAAVNNFGKRGQAISTNWLQRTQQ